MLVLGPFLLPRRVGRIAAASGTKPHSFSIIFYHAFIFFQVKQAFSSVNSVCRLRSLSKIPDFTNFSSISGIVPLHCSQNICIILQLSGFKGYFALKSVSFLRILFKILMLSSQIIPEIIKKTLISGIPPASIAHFPGFVISGASFVSIISAITAGSTAPLQSSAVTIRFTPCVIPSQ